ncbi:MAG: DUF4169 domain-containing protein [Proteobacteria bacterium]|jgi:hypothetical protein|nr:MAG: DUF4169 domain-containing protein [Pseudomonadota bacterium]
MAEIINLRRVKKTRQRQTAAKAAADNRARFGRTKAEKDQARRQADLEAKRQESHRLEDD